MNNSLTPTTAHALLASGHRTIAAYNWQQGSYIELSDSLMVHSVHGQARGQKRPTASDHVAGLPPYQAYFDAPVWVAVRVAEDD